MKNDKNPIYNNIIYQNNVLRVTNLADYVINVLTWSNEMHNGSDVGLQNSRLPIIANLLLRAINWIVSICVYVRYLLVVYMKHCMPQFAPLNITVDIYFIFIIIYLIHASFPCFGFFKCKIGNFQGIIEYTLLKLDFPQVTQKDFNFKP